MNELNTAHTNATMNYSWPFLRFITLDTFNPGAGSRKTFVLLGAGCTLQPSTKDYTEGALPKFQREFDGGVCRYMPRRRKTAKVSLKRKKAGPIFDVMMSHRSEHEARHLWRRESMRVVCKRTASSSVTSPKASESSKRYLDIARAMVVCRLNRQGSKCW